MRLVCSGLGAAFEQDGVAAFEAQGRNLHQGVRPGFEDDADDADGAGDLVEFQPLSSSVARQGLADGVWQVDQAFDARDRPRRFWPGRI